MSGPQRLLAPFAVFGALIYGFSFDAQVQERFQSWERSSLVSSLIDDFFSPSFFADAQEERKRSRRDDDDDKPRSTPQRTPSMTPTPRITPTPLVSATPEPSPASTPVSLADVIATPMETPIPSPMPEQVVLNLEPARRVVSGALQAISFPSGAFKVGASGKPYPYGNEKLDTSTTLKFYAMAAAMAMFGLALFNLKNGK